MSGARQGGGVSGRLIGTALIVAGLVAGAALYYLQVFHYYDEVGDRVGDIRLVPASGGRPLAVSAGAVRAIDAESSPIRFRACFQANRPLPALERQFQTYPQAEPLTAPGWFDCYDAGEIGAALERGEARAFLAGAGPGYGIDRVVAVLPDGRGFAWQQINRCGRAVFDGDPLPRGCPPPPDE